MSRSAVPTRKANSEPYHKAVSRGRHPRSFPPTSDVWQYVKSAKYREKKVSQGQHLFDVLDRHNAGKEKLVSALPDTDEGESTLGGIGDQVIQPTITLQSSATKEIDREAKLRALSGRLSNFRQIKHRELNQLRQFQKRHGGKGVHDDSTLRKFTKAQNEREKEAEATKFTAASLANEFSSQPDARLHFGASIALESVFYEDKFLQVEHPQGSVHCHPMDMEGDTKTRKMVFQVLDMKDLQCADPIKFGDSIWLQLAAGSGEPDWQHGSVFGAKVRHAPQLETVSLGCWPIRNPADVTSEIGFPAPVNASLPRGREDQSDSIKDALVNVHSTKNKKPTFLGRWKILPATVVQKAKELEYELSDDKDKDKRSEAAQHITNFSEVYLEQDWFYVSTDPDSDRAILRQLPKQAPKGSQYVIDRRGIWKIRILDSDTQTGLTLVQQQMERLLGKAKMQLRQSNRMRNGQSKTYEEELSCGRRFPKQIRNKLRKIQDKTDQTVINREHTKHAYLHEFFEERYQGVRLNKLPPTPFINPHHNGSGPFSKKDWKIRATSLSGTRKQSEHAHAHGHHPHTHTHTHVDEKGHLITSKAMPVVSKSMPLLGHGGTSPKHAEHNVHHLSPLHHLSRSKKQRHLNVHKHKKTRAEVKAVLKDRQAIRKRQLGHFPSFFDLPSLLAKLEIQEGAVRGMLLDEHGEKQIDADMRDAMDNAQTPHSRQQMLAQKLEKQDSRMEWNLDYKRKHEKLSGLFDTLYNQQQTEEKEKGSTFITQPEGENGIDGSSAETAMGVLGKMGGKQEKPPAPPLNLDVAMHRFDGNIRHLTDMLNSLKQLCEERVMPQLHKSLAQLDTQMMLEEAEFLMEAGDIVGADPLAATGAELIASIDEIDKEEELQEAQQHTTGTEEAPAKFEPEPKKVERLQAAHKAVVTKVDELMAHITENFPEEAEQHRSTEEPQPAEAQAAGAGV